MYNLEVHDAENDQILDMIGDVEPNLLQMVMERLFREYEGTEIEVLVTM